MKKVIFLIIFTIIGLTSFSQGTIQLNVKWNTTASKYEVYARPSFTQNNFNWGSSQIGIVVPSSAPDQAFAITSIGAGAWSDNTRAYAPSAQASNDFHAVGSNGSLINMTSGQESLIFTFTFPDGQCRDGIRLFVNNSDPSSSAAGMNGGDFKNTIANALLADVYISNYNNTGTQCSACNITAPELSKQ